VKYALIALIPLNEQIQVWDIRLFQSRYMFVYPAMSPGSRESCGHQEQYLGVGKAYPFSMASLPLSSISIQNIMPRDYGRVTLSYITQDLDEACFASDVLPRDDNMRCLCFF
jgi:hypothetical protein